MNTVMDFILRSMRRPRFSLLVMVLTAAFILPPNNSPEPVPDILVAYTHHQPEDLAMIDLQEYIPGIEVDLRYAGSRNVWGKPFYSSPRAYLRLGTAKKLKSAQEEFERCGYSLKVWDAYRPPEAQFKLWEKCSDPRFVINPHTGFSYHSRGVALDVTLTDAQGNELVMPSGFDEFSGLADRDFSDITAERANHAELLELIMKENGFDSIYYEWWHFVDHDRAYYDVADPTEVYSLSRN